MIRLFVIIFTLLHFTASGAFSGTVDDAQRLLNQLGYNAGPVDGAYGRKTRGALEAFYADTGGSFDGKLDANEVADLQAAMAKRMPNRSTDYYATSGVSIENSHPVVKVPPFQTTITRKKYGGEYYWYNQDFNQDGLQDFLIVGTMKPDNRVPNEQNTSGGAVGVCNYSDCVGYKYGPTLYLGQADGTYNDHSDLIIDNSDDPGMSVPRQTLIADYNGDGVLDIYIADNGFVHRGKDKGEVDLYYLSQPDGTWLESSQTHFSDPNISLFNHGATTGDIDGDGDMDVVMTTMDEETVCWFNDGTGYMKKKRNCSRAFTFAIELADMDNDGDLDLVHGGRGNRVAGILLNNGRGKFSKKVRLPKTKGEWELMPEVSVWDLDNDGDQDVVISRTKDFYVGTAVEVIENLGNGKFDSQYFILREAPKHVQNSIVREGNDWNNFVDNFRFADIDNDGDTDVVLHSEFWKPESSKYIRGSVLLNQGNFQFEHVPQGDKRNTVKILRNLMFKSDDVAYQSVRKPTMTKAFEKFKTFLSGEVTFVHDEGKFTPYDHPILLEKSGALVVGASRVKVFRNFALADILIEWGDKKIVTTLAAQKSRKGSTYYTLSMKKGTMLIDQEVLGFGKLEKLETAIGKNCGNAMDCFVHTSDFKKNNIDIGILELLEDFNGHGGYFTFTAAKVISEEELNVFKSTFETPKIR